MHDPLIARRAAGALQIKDDVLADAAYIGNARACQRARDLAGRRLQRLGLAADPDAFNHIASHLPCQAAGDGFDFRQFRHPFSGAISSSRLRVSQFPVVSSPTISSNLYLRHPNGIYATIQL